MINTMHQLGVYYYIKCPVHGGNYLALGDPTLTGCVFRLHQLVNMKGNSETLVNTGIIPLQRDKPSTNWCSFLPSTVSWGYNDVMGCCDGSGKPPFLPGKSNHL